MGPNEALEPMVRVPCAPVQLLRKLPGGLGITELFTEQGSTPACTAPQQGGMQAFPGRWQKPSLALLPCPPPRMVINILINI